MIVPLLLILLLLLAITIVVGHGLWVLLAYLFRGPASPAETHAKPANAGDEWDVTARQVERLFQSGLIDAGVRHSLQAAIRRARMPSVPLPPPPLPVLAIEPIANELALPTDTAASEADDDLILPDRDFPIPAETPAAAVASVIPVALPPRRPQAKLEPRKPLSEHLASFMERKNIRWGELVGGLLIVGCSIALVLSFWAQIQQHPLMKFSIFTAVTAALFSLGLYSEHRWKLATTSRGILLTATLLIPLNFLAFAAFSHGVPAADPIALGGELVAFALFFVLAWAAARVIVPQWPGWLAVGVMILSAGTLAVRYLSVDAAEAELPPARVLLLSALVVLCYVVTSGGVLFKVRRWASVDGAGANAALLSLAVLSFATVFPLVLIVARGADGSLHRLAPLIELAGLPALASGVLLRKRVIEPALVRLRVAATGVSVVGAAILLAGIALAWPSPAEMLATSLIAFTTLFAIAVSEGSAFWFGAAQAAASLAAVATVLFCLGREDANADRVEALLTDVATWRIIATTWAALSLAWAVLRFTASRIIAAPTRGTPVADAAPSWRYNVRTLARTPYTFDRLTSALLLVALASLALLATYSGVMMEFGTTGQANGLEPILPPIARAIAGPLPWLVLVTLLVSHVANALEELRRQITWPALTICWVACPLWAAAHSGGMAGAATAFRWADAAWLLSAAGVVWWRGRSPVVCPASFDEQCSAGELANAPLRDCGETKAREMQRADQRQTARATTTPGHSGASGHPSVPSPTPRRPGFEALPDPARRSHQASQTGDPPAPADLVDVVLLLLGVLPIVLLSLYQAAQILNGNVDALAPATFGAAGPVVVSAGPLLAVAVFLIGQSLRYRSNGYAAAAALAVNLFVSTAYVIATAGTGALDTTRFARLIQLNIATTATASLAWLFLWFIFVKQRQPASAPPAGPGQAPPGILQACAWTALAANLFLIVPPAAGLFLMPQGTFSLSATEGDIWGWVALALSSVAVACIAMLRRRPPLAAAGLVLPMIAALSAVTAAPWDRGNWLSFHVWMGSQTAAAWAIVAVGWWFERRTRFRTEVVDSLALAAGSSPIANAAQAVQGDHVALALDYQRSAVAPGLSLALSPVGRSAIGWAGVFGLLAVILALRDGLGDPASPWPSSAVIVFIGLLAAALAVWAPAPAALYPAAALLNLAATLVYCAVPARFGGFSASGLVEVNVAALALPAIAWLVLELHVFRPRRPGDRRVLPVHRFAAFASLSLLAAATGFTFATGLFGFSTVAPAPLLDVSAFAAVAGLLVACLWDDPPVPAFGLLYVLGLVVSARLVQCFDVPANRLAWAGALALAAYGLFTNFLYALRGTVSPLAARLALPIARKERLLWLESVNFGLAGVVLVAAFCSDFAFDSVGLRLLPAAAALAQFASIGLLARQGGRSQRQDLMRAALLAGVAASLALVWAFVNPAGDAQGLQHSAMAAALMTAVAVPLAMAFLGKPPRRNPWLDAVRADASVLAVACLISLAASLGLEACAQATLGRVEMPMGTIVAVAIAAFACCVTAIILAMRPWVGERAGVTFAVNAGRRQAGCVYAAEALLALFFAHVRLTLPFLFHGYLERYWPLIVMAIAFAGVGIGEALRRRGRLAFAEPLQNTGAFLPLIPVLAFWVSPLHVNYTLLLLLAAALYGSLAFLRRSTTYGMLAALAGNGSLWYVLSTSETLGFFAHPQVWVIPAALSGLIALELNRSNLSAAQLRSGRYFFLGALYLSSSADLFINATAHSTWLPLILAGLAVAGVLAGVGLRVRPFLFLGTAFLTLSIVAMIYNAAASLHVTWIWYVAGILLGLFIIVLFALFEKKRSTMLALVEGLKSWQ